MQGTQQDVAVAPLAMAAPVLARHLGISLRHLKRLQACGKLLAPVRLGRSVRWALAETEAWLAAGAPDRATWEAMKKAGATKGGRV